MISVSYSWVGSNVKCWSLSITNASRGTVNAWRFQSHWAEVVMVVVFEFSVMRCQPLRRALCLITKNQWIMVFLCSLGWLVLCLSASWLQRALFSGQLFFGAGNSENCLNQFSGKCEVRAAWLNQYFEHRFWGLNCWNSQSVFQIYESFQFFRS